ncbi:ABC-2 type transporter-domain-containing protein [Myxozyma melibiosi]|uniref:ABC-2 type transporter-domain-containing protein n=1 Tax=Myxozyma melibiosi TaxID=54550 RepID=A0ABR1FCV1_9ASCO
MQTFASMSSSNENESKGSFDLELQDVDHQNALQRELTHRMASGDDIDRVSRLSRVLTNLSAKNVEGALDEDDLDFVQSLRRILHQRENDGIVDRSIGILFEDLTVRGIDMGAKALNTVGELLMKPLKLPQAIREARNVQYRNIIEGFDGVVHAGEMLLVLGRPGSGCSTFLRAVAGEIDSFKGVTGEISYDGIDQATMKERYKGDVVFSPEQDIHFPILTVDETLSFAAGIKAPRTRAGNISRDQYVKDVRDILATVFGLRHTYNTRVGNDYIRGVSGGERKRVSLAEVMAGGARFVSWDNATRGLDASTALEYAQTLRASTTIMKNTAVVAIYQAGENIYKLFDKVTVIYAGRQIFFGPVDKGKEYFENMGYLCRPRQTTAEFLTALTDPARVPVRPGYEGKVPFTPEEFVAYWKSSDNYREMEEEMATYKRDMDPTGKLHELMESTKQERPHRFKRKKSPYTLSFIMQLRVLIKRGFERQKGDKAFMASSLFSALAQSLIVGSLFYNITDTYNGAFSRGGCVFFALLFFTINAMAEMALSYPQRMIVEKQKRFAFYHPAAEAISAFLTAMPLRVISMIIFTIIFYFLVNLQVKAGQFFLFLLVLQVSTLTISLFFQMISAVSPTLEVANSIAGLGIMIIFIYAGFLIPLPLMKVWFRWLNYLNPLRFSFEALLANEMHAREMDCTANLIPSGASYENVSIDYRVCAATGSESASDHVSGDRYISTAFQFSFSHFWRDFGIVVAYGVLFFVLYVLGTEFTSPAGTVGDVLVFRRGHMPGDKPKKELEKVAENSINNTDDTAELDPDLQMTEIFSWQHVNYTVTLPNGEDRQLLCDVQGYTKPGTLTALMGESGAGKTTLLNNLAKRINVGVISGDIFVDGKPLQIDFKRRTGYVQQQDLHVAESTVRESLRFSAVLRQPASVPLQEKYDYCERVIEMLEMQDYAEAVVGVLGQGLNVEQRKKLSIGVELAAKPSLLLFLDEPTSGLDSQSAWAIVQLLRKLANAGQSILCTIHQPSATLFEQFDRLLLLRKGGQTVYFGPIGESSHQVIEYFETNGAAKCGDEENPAEYILNCIGAGATAQASSNWYDIWTASSNFRELTAEIEQMHAELAKKPARQVSKELSRQYAANYMTQLKLVVIRMFDQYWRDPQYITAKAMLMLTSGLFVGFSFWHADHTLQGIQNLLFGVFLSIIIGVPMMNQLEPRVITLRELYEVRENPSNTYHWSILLIASLVAEIPYNVLFSTLYYCCYYWPVGFNRSTKAAGYQYFVYSVLYPLYYTTFGIAITTISADAATANVITGLLVCFVVSFAGIFQPPSAIPHFWKFMYRISPFTYFLDTLLGNVLHDVEVECADTEFNIFNPPDGQTCYNYAEAFIAEEGGYLNNPNATSSCQYCKWTVGDNYLSTVGMDYSTDRWRDIGFIFVFIIFNFCASFILYYIYRVSTFNLFTFVKVLFKKKAKK